ncbi:hypothetical protein [Engelhardtia mirabilis]
MSFDLELVIDPASTGRLKRGEITTWVDFGPTWSVYDDLDGKVSIHWTPIDGGSRVRHEVVLFGYEESGSLGYVFASGRVDVDTDRD